MRYFNFQISCLDYLSNSIADLWTAMSYAQNRAAYWLKPCAVPIHSCVECFAVPSGQFYNFKFCYSRILANLKMPFIFWY